MSGAGVMAAPMRALQRGYTMVEMLIAMFVLSVGVLGVAALQLTTLENLQLSQQYGLAAMLADDMAERMMANPDEARDGGYVHTGAKNNPRDCAAETCSEAQMAEYDIAEWQQTLADVMYSGAGEVDRVGSTDEFIITVYWDEDLSGSTEKNCPVESDEDLDCYQTTVGL